MKEDYCDVNIRFERLIRSIEGRPCGSALIRLRDGNAILAFAPEHAFDKLSKIEEEATCQKKN